MEAITVNPNAYQKMFFEGLYHFLSNWWSKIKRMEIFAANVDLFQIALQKMMVIGGLVFL